jgi:hypothetical protein
MKGLDITRRDVLAGIGATGLATVAGLGVGTGDAVVYPVSAQTESNGFTLEVDWRETYNGEVLEDTRAADWTSTGPVISLTNVLPGDSGTFSFRIGVADGEETSVEPQVAFDLTATPENGRNEPERQAGDTSPNDGELEDVVEAQIWEDEGFLDQPIFGGDNAERDGEPLVREGAEGTLADVADALPTDDPVSLGCLDGDETVTVALAWEFPRELDDRDINITQGDGATFDLQVYAVSCDGGGG